MDGTGRRKSPKAKLAERLKNADKMTEGAIRALSVKALVEQGKEENANRTLSVLPGLPGNTYGAMDWKEFYAFCYDTLGYTDMMPQPHDEICQFIAKLFPDLTFKGTEQKFGFIMVPRNCFKSVIFSVALPLFLLWKNKNARILLSGHRHDASKEQLRTIKWNIENNEKFKKLCGEWKPKFKEQKYAEDSIIILGRTMALRDPSIDTCGVDRSKVGAHPDVIICDDLHSEKNVMTGVMRNKVFDHIIAMYPMLQPGGTMVVVGTRWHHSDAYGKVLSLDDKAIIDGQEPTYETLIRSCYIQNPDGSQGLYFPTRLSKANLDKLLYKVGKTKFSLWYLNKPIDDDDRLFPRAKLKDAILDLFIDSDSGYTNVHYEQDYLPLSITMAWDPAGISASDKSDFHGVTIVGCDPDERWFVPCAEAIKAKPDAVLARIANIILRYQPETLILEDVGQSGTWGYLLRNYCQANGIHCPPIALYKTQNKGTKSDRIQSLQPRWEAGTVIIDRRCRELIDQFDNFPQLDYDDLLDSLQMHLDYAQPPYHNDQALLWDQDDIEIEPRVVVRSPGQPYAGEGSSNWGSALQRK